MIVPYIPKDVLNIILDYDGRIKFIKGHYVNRIYKYDLRYNIILPIIIKKIVIIEKNTQLIENSGFYFEFGFDNNNLFGLCYDYNFSSPQKFEICYYNFKNDLFLQIRTYL